MQNREHRGEPALAGPLLAGQERALRNSALKSFLVHNPQILGVLDEKTPIDFFMRGSVDGGAPISAHAIPIEILKPDVPTIIEMIESLDDGLECIVLRNILNKLSEYRLVLAKAFAKLSVGGYLLLFVPHQFLYERKLQPPSRFDPRNSKFYTPGILLSEIEESLDPGEYRLRCAVDNDAGFDYGKPLSEAPAGGSDIVVCLERIAKPAWQDAIATHDLPTRTMHQPTRFLRHEAKAPYHVVSPGTVGRAGILAIKLDHRGDFLLAEPAFKALRAAFPRIPIAVCCGSWNVGTATAMKLFDKIIPFDFFPEDGSIVRERKSHKTLLEEFATLISGTQYSIALDLRLYEDTRELLQAVNAEHKAGFDPYNMFPWLDIRMAVPIPTRDGRAEQGLVAATKFLTGPGEHRGYDILIGGRKPANENEGLVWGPYVDLPAGDYDFEVIVEPLADRAELLFDVCCDSGRRKLTYGVIHAEKNRYPRFSMALSERIRDFELRLFPPKGGAVPQCRFMGLRYARAGAYIGVHQTESMALLVHLVAMRLRFPIETSLGMEA